MANSSNNTSFGSVSPDRYINANMAAPPTFYEVMKSRDATANLDTALPGGAQSHRGTFMRQQSRSCEELGAYQKMDTDVALMSYENETFAKGDESSHVVDGVYSYASPVGTRGSYLSSAANRSVVTPRVYQKGEPQKLSRKSISDPNLVEGVDLSEAAPHRDGQHRPAPFNFELINSHQGTGAKRNDHFTNGPSGSNSASPMPTAATPSPRSALSSVISPGFLRGSGVTDKSRLFVKRQTEVTTPPSGAAGDNSKSMGGRRLPTIPDAVVKETSCWWSGNARSLSPPSLFLQQVFLC